MIAAVREVEMALAQGKFLQVGSESRASELTAQEISRALHEYTDRKLTLTPDVYLVNSVEAIEVKNAQPKQWVVDLDPWFENEHSDLTLSLDFGGTIRWKPYRSNR
jgi:hypothetical protein